MGLLLWAHAWTKTEWWGAGVDICLERGADLHMAQLMPLPLSVSCFSKIQIGFTFLVPAHPGSPGQRAIECAIECVCVPMLGQTDGRREGQTDRETLYCYKDLAMHTMHAVQITLLLLLLLTQRERLTKLPESMHGVVVRISTYLLKSAVSGRGTRGQHGCSRSLCHADVHLRSAVMRSPRRLQLMTIASDCWLSCDHTSSSSSSSGRRSTSCHLLATVTHTHAHNRLTAHCPREGLCCLQCFDAVGWAAGRASGL